MVEVPGPTGRAPIPVTTSRSLGLVAGTGRSHPARSDVRRRRFRAASITGRPSARSWFDVEHDNVRAGRLAEPGDRPELAGCLSMLARCLDTMGEFDLAEQYATASIEMCRRLPDQDALLVKALRMLAVIEENTDRLTQARTRYEEALAIARRLDAELGDYRRAARLLGASDALRDRLQSPLAWHGRRERSERPSTRPALPYPTRSGQRRISQVSTRQSRTSSPRPSKGTSDRRLVSHCRLGTLER